MGGVIIDGDKVLLVKLTYGHMGWILPGGYVKSTETIGQAVKREVREETGLDVEPLKLISVRSRAEGGKCDVYMPFLVRVLGGKMKPDKAEISDLRYFTLEEMEARSDVPKLNTWIVRQRVEAKYVWILTFKRQAEPLTALRTMALTQRNRGSNEENSRCYNRWRCAGYECCH